MSKASTAGKKPGINPEIVYKNGKPTKVLIDIKEFEALLEVIEDREALDWLKRSRKESKSYRSLEDVLSELQASE